MFGAGHLTSFRNSTRMTKGGSLRILNSTIQTIHAPRRAGEDRGLLIRRAARRDALQRIEQSGITDPHFLDREVTFDDATVGAEQFDARLDIGPPGIRQL